MDDKIVKGSLKERAIKIVEQMCLFDDELMSQVFDNNPEPTSYLLSVIFGKDVKVLSVKTQKRIKGNMSGDKPLGRDVILDVYAEIEGEGVVDIEIQRSATKNDMRRARYYSSILDYHVFEKGKDWSDLNDLYVIFICDYDMCGLGYPLYKVSRKYDHGQDFNDGSHIYFVNGQYSGDDDVASLISDMKQSDPSKISSSVLAQYVAINKEKIGESKMSEIVEKFGNEMKEEGIAIGEAKGRAEERVETLQRSLLSIMKTFHVSFEMAADTLNIPKEERASFKNLIEN